MKSKQIGLYFGSFNPVHIGHMAIANFMVTAGGMDEVWFIVSPRSPFKEKSSLMPDYHRLEMVHLAIGDDSRMRASNIEFGMPQPNYTSRTLVALKEKYPKHHFHLMMGSDNLAGFHKWHQYEFILAECQLLVYPRPNAPGGDLQFHPSVRMVEAPHMDISASFVREHMRAGQDMRHFLPPKVWHYLEDNQLLTRKKSGTKIEK